MDAKDVLTFNSMERPTDLTPIGPSPSFTKFVGMLDRFKDLTPAIKKKKLGEYFDFWRQIVGKDLVSLSSNGLSHSKGPSLICARRQFPVLRLLIPEVGISLFDRLVPVSFFDKCFDAERFRSDLST